MHLRENFRELQIPKLFRQLNGFKMSHGNFVIFNPFNWQNAVWSYNSREFSRKCNHSFKEINRDYTCEKLHSRGVASNSIPPIKWTKNESRMHRNFHDLFWIHLIGRMMLEAATLESFYRKCNHSLRSTCIAIVL